MFTLIPVDYFKSSCKHPSVNDTACVYNPQHRFTIFQSVDIPNQTKQETMTNFKIFYSIISKVIQ